MYPFIIISLSVAIGNVPPLIIVIIIIVSGYRQYTPLITIMSLSVAIGKVPPLSLL